MKTASLLAEKKQHGPSGVTHSSYEIRVDETEEDSSDASQSQSTEAKYDEKELPDPAAPAAAHSPTRRGGLDSESKTEAQKSPAVAAAPSEPPAQGRTMKSKELTKLALGSEHKMFGGPTHAK